MRSLRVQPVAAALAAALLLAGCGSTLSATADPGQATTTTSTPASSTTTSPASTTTTSTSAPSTTTTSPAKSTTTTSVPAVTVETCTAAQLQVSFSEEPLNGPDMLESNQEVRFVNISATPCSLRGAPSVTFYSVDGPPIAHVRYLDTPETYREALGEGPGDCLEMTPQSCVPIPDPSGAFRTTPPPVLLEPGGFAMLALTEQAANDCPGDDTPSRSVVFDLPGGAGTITATHVEDFQCPDGDASVSWFAQGSTLQALVARYPSALEGILLPSASFTVPPQTATAG